MEAAMRITFIGGARTVTGAAYRVETTQAAVLVDCGLFQGPRALEERNRRMERYRPLDVDAVVLTHAHMDHAGLVPALVKAGYKGPIYCTPATRDLCEIMLLDSAHIQEMEAAWETRRNLRVGRKPVLPLYDQQDARKALSLFSQIPYGRRERVASGVHVRFQDAGHILGSASVELWADDGGRGWKLVFSGDIGRKNQPIIQDPQPIEEAQIVLVESTYGDRLHKSHEETLDEFLSVILEAVRERGKVVIPSFAVGRTQEVLYILHEFLRKGLIPDIPVYVDSPLAIAATEIFNRHPECFDGQARALLRRGDEPLRLPHLVLCRTTEESMAINQMEGPAIIIAASGMCNAGRIKHHLKHNLWRSNSHIVFIGYQAQGTVGRQIVDGARSVRILGEPVTVAAKVHTLGGFSAHADRDELLGWVRHLKTPGLKVFVVHGEERGALSLADALGGCGIPWVAVPRLLDSFELGEAVPSAAHPLTERHLPIDALMDVERRLRRLRKRLSKKGLPSEEATHTFTQRAHELQSSLEQMESVLQLRQGEDDLGGTGLSEVQDGS